MSAHPGEEEILCPAKLKFARYLRQLRLSWHNMPERQPGAGRTLMERRAPIAGTRSIRHGDGVQLKRFRIDKERQTQKEITSPV
jgi:hypothetical protein